jgi:hypothetical protein
MWVTMMRFMAKTLSELDRHASLAMTALGLLLV